MPDAAALEAHSPGVLAILREFGPRLKRRGRLVALIENEAARAEKADSTGTTGDLFERLLAGPDDAELTARELALLAAHLHNNRPHASWWQQQNRGMKCPELERYQKLKRVLDFNRNLQAALAPPAPDQANGNAGSTPPTVMLEQRGIMADSSPRLSPAAIEAAARDAGTILLSRPWLVEDELLLRLLTEAGHSRTLADLALQWLLERQLTQIEFRPDGDDVHKCYKRTDTLRDWLAAATSPAAKPGESEEDGAKNEKRKARKKRSDPKADKTLADAWNSGAYRTFAALAQEKDKTPREVKLAIDRQRKRQAAKGQRRSKPRQ